MYYNTSYEHFLSIKLCRNSKVGADAVLEKEYVIMRTILKPYANFVQGNFSQSVRCLTRLSHGVKPLTPQQTSTMGYLSRSKGVGSVANKSQFVFWSTLTSLGLVVWCKLGRDPRIPELTSFRFPVMAYGNFRLRGDDHDHGVPVVSRNRIHPKVDC